jgi:transcriptional regulator with XRE-family HTH domain
MPQKTQLVDKPMYVALGIAIRKSRDSKVPPMTQEGLAGASGIARATIANIERGRQHVLVHTLVRIMRALDVKFEDLVMNHASKQDSTASHTPELEKNLQRLSATLRKRIKEKVS